MKIKIYILIVIMMTLLVSATAQDADAGVAIFGNGPLGDFDGSLSYNAASATNATLTVTLKNISPAANGGFLTAFVFNNPGNYISGVDLLATDPDFGLLGASSFIGGISGSPYGNFDIGASTGGSFEGGGKPSKGIAAGATETFTFMFTGYSLNTLDENSFMSELSSGSGAGEGYESFVARFRGFNDGGSNHTPGYSTPEPATLTLLGLGFFGLLGLKRKNK